MRALVLILLVALLPLRMWAAEGMAVRMAHQEVTAAMGMASMPDDCPMMAESGAAQGSGEEAPPGTGHCAACHLCAASACLPGPVLGNGRSPAGPPAFGTPRYASAEVAPALRPPIA